MVQIQLLPPNISSIKIKLSLAETPVINRGFCYFCGSSRKVRERNRKKPDKSEEEVIIPIAISEAFGNFDFVVKALKFAS